MKKATFLKGRTLLLLVTLVAVLCSISAAPVNAEEEATVRILESPITIQEEDIGKPFNITLIIENVPEDPGAVWVEFELSWQSAILRGVSMVLPPGHFMTPDDDPGNLVKLRHEVTPRKVYYKYTFFDKFKDYLPKYGNGTLAIITLKSIAPGTTDLHFDAIAVSSPPLDVSTTPVDGTVEVVPEFSAFMIPLLFMVATAFAVVVRRKGWLGKRRSPSR